MRKVQVIWSSEALTDLEAIYDFIAENSQQVAQQIIESILGRVRQLESFPESGTTLETIESGTGRYRYLVEGHYKVIYSYQPEIQTVYIAVVFDTRFNPERLRV